MCFAFFAWFARAALLAGIVKTATGKTCKVQNACSIGTLFKCSDTNAIFETAIFLILVVKNNKMSSSLDVKTSYRLSRNCYIMPILILSYVSASNCSLNRLNLSCDCCFFADFLMVRALLVKNYQIKVHNKVWYLFLALCTCFNSFSI